MSDGVLLISDRNFSSQKEQIMKTPIKLTLAVAVLASASTSFADDPQMRNLLELRRLAAERNQEAASVAVYTGTRGIGGTKSGNVAHAENAGTRFEWRTNAHGGQYGTFVPNNR